MSATPLSKSLVLALHERQITLIGGLSGVGDEGILDSALAQPFATFDGNKRTGTIALATFLKQNGCRFKPRHKDLQDIILGVASGQKDYEDLVTFVRDNARA